jgi:hypothetical protein
MAAEIITKEDLEEFRKTIISEIAELLNGKNHSTSAKWLKSYQVKNLLRISPGTLQNLRVNGSLPFTKIGGIIYYKFEDVQKLLNGK